MTELEWTSEQPTAPGMYLTANLEIANAPLGQISVATVVWDGDTEEAQALKVDSPWYQPLPYRSVAWFGPLPAPNVARLQAKYLQAAHELRLLQLRGEIIAVRRRLDNALPDREALKQRHDEDGPHLEVDRVSWLYRPSEPGGPVEEVVSVLATHRGCGGTLFEMSAVPGSASRYVRGTCDCCDRAFIIQTPQIPL